MKIIKSTIVPLPLENIDTDQIIPARFLKATTREGFGERLMWKKILKLEPIKNDASLIITMTSITFFR